MRLGIRKNICQMDEAQEHARRKAEAPIRAALAAAQRRDDLMQAKDARASYRKPLPPIPGNAVPCAITGVFGYRSFISAADRGVNDRNAGGAAKKAGEGAGGVGAAAAAGKALGGLVAKAASVPGGLIATAADYALGC